MTDLPDNLRQVIDDAVRDAVLNNTQLTEMAARMANQSYALREIAKVLYEHGIPATRFSRRTTDVLVAVALNGDY